MASTYTPIATTTVAVAATTVTFSSIPSTYTDLVLVCAGTALTAIDLRLTFNSDTGTNYSRTYIYGNGSTAGSGRDTSVAYMAMGALNSTNQGNDIIQIQNYANTTTYKTAISRVNTDGATNATVGLWRSTAAINRIDINASSGTISAGSTFTLYGITAA